MNRGIFNKLDFTRVIEKSNVLETEKRYFILENVEYPVQL